MRSYAEARQSMGRAIDHLLTISDEALEREWAWTGESQADVRSGFYIGLQELMRATGELTGSPDGRGPNGHHPAAGALAAATAARWELHGVLAPLADALLDADPGGGEWTVRQTLAHTVHVVRVYPYFSGWWVSRRDHPDYPSQAPDSLDEDLPTEEANAEGSVGQIRDRMDALLDLSMEIWRDATEEDLAARARWMGYPVPVGFRVGRWGPHVEEHTLQVDKTLVMLGRTPSEVERLVRLLLRAMGRMEAAAWMLPPAALEDGAGVIMGAAAAEVERIAREISEVAGG